MFKNKNYMKLGFLVLMLASILILIIFTQKNIVSISSGQVKKEDSKGQVQPDNRRYLIIKRLKEEGSDLAIRSAEEYLASNPNDIDIINLLAVAYMNKNDLSAADETVKRALAIQPRNAWSSRLLAHIYRIKPEKDPAVKNNNLTLALEQIERSLASNPDDTWLLAEAAQVYSEQGNKVKANQTIDRALSINPNEASLVKIKEMINTVVEKPTKK